MRIRGERKTEDGRRRLGDRRPKTEDGSWKTGVGSRKREDRRPKTEDGSWKSEVGRRETEVSSWETEVSSWETEGGRRKIRVSGLMVLVLVLFVLACSGKKSDGAKVQERLDNAEIKYFTNGKKLYTQHCSNCHMENGEGLGRLIPPLKNSDYLLSDIPRSALIIQNGIDSAITVNGVEYQQPMPANLSLNPTEIAEILTYITNAWGNEYGGIDPELIKEVLKK